MNVMSKYCIKTKGPILFSFRGWLYVGYAAFLLACLILLWVLA